MSNSKHFLSLPLIQHLVNQIYVGHLIYTPSSSRSLITDTYVSQKTRIRRRPSHSSVTTRGGVGTAATATTSTQDGRGQVDEVEGEELAEVYTYNPYESSWLDHQRLRVPKWRKWLEFLSFGILLSLFVATLAGTSLPPVLPSHPNPVRSMWELVQMFSIMGSPGGGVMMAEGRADVSVS